MPLRLRRSRVRRGDKTYVYYQLARAVRRAGKPTHEIVAHLGRLPDEEAEALRAGLDTLRPKTACEAGELLVRLEDVRVHASLRYLDLRLVRAMWDEWALGDFIEAKLPSRDSAVAAADLVFALIANRCLAPCSKLRLLEWLPHTALPELLGFDLRRVNNSRIHRVLDDLDGIEPALTTWLVQHPLRRVHPSAVIFLDLTTSWFEGHGGSYGKRGRLKGGAIHRHTIQIALAVDDHGIPLRWEVLPGNTCEAKVFPAWVAALAQHEELASLPLVFDRGLATQENLALLIREQRSFVTCARLTQVQDYTTDVDLAALAGIAAQGTPRRQQIVLAGLRASDDDDIYFLDLGVIQPGPIDRIPEPGLRVVPYFRPSLYVRNHESLARLRANVDEQIAALNEDLRQAKMSRTEDNTRRKVSRMLERFDLVEDYDIHLDPIEVAGRKKLLRSYQIRLTRREGFSNRELNAGWMLLLAHPSDTRAPLELIREYHKKHVVEHDFRVIKSFVELRPIRHQTDAKIRTHVTLCVLALLIDRYVELKLRSAGTTDSIDRVYEALEPCRLQVLSGGRGPNRLRVTETNERQRELFAKVGLSQLTEQAASDRLEWRRH